MRSRRTNFHKILEVHQPVPRLVMIPNDLQYLRLLQVKSQCSHRNLELMIVDATVLVRVEELEGLLDLLLLLIGELGARVGAPLGFLGGSRSVHVAYVFLVDEDA